MIFCKKIYAWGQTVIICLPTIVILSGCGSVYTSSHYVALQCVSGRPSYTEQRAFNQNNYPNSGILSRPLYRVPQANSAIVRPVSNPEPTLSVRMFYQDQNGHRTLPPITMSPGEKTLVFFDRNQGLDGRPEYSIKTETLISPELSEGGRVLLASSKEITSSANLYSGLLPRSNTNSVPSGDSNGTGTNFFAYLRANPNATITFAGLIFSALISGIFRIGAACVSKK